jgi:leader peptidase (prepilin peptidase)/N-methyltransferase
MLMFTLIYLIFLGLCLGSFVNALVWRIHEQSKTKDKKKLRELSILRGRSQCTDCGHQLTAIDLVPVFSWLSTRGKCRYCKKSISAQYPLVEVLAAALITASYVFWPYASPAWTGAEIATFGLWTIILTGLLALCVYDIRWYLLPDRIVFPLIVLGVMYAVALSVARTDEMILLEAGLGAFTVFGVFWLLFQFSKGAWIGGGDVKLAILLGLLAGSVMNALLLIFLASILGTMYAVLLGVIKKQKITGKMRIPFGPFLILATYIVVLFGAEIVEWYAAFILSV